MRRTPGGHQVLVGYLAPAPGTELDLPAALRRLREVLPAPLVPQLAVVADLPTGLGRLVVLDGAGHYPHVQFPDEVAATVLAFLADIRA